LSNLRIARKSRILNVDDNEIGRYTKTRILKIAEFEVIEAENGLQALELVRSQHPDLVLLDLQLPDVDGFEVCRRIKSSSVSARIPVLHITATGGANNSEASSIESGADIFLQQPVEPEELITVVRTLLRLRSTELGLAETEERMRLAIEGVGIATWDIDLRHGTAHLSSEMHALLGREPREGPLDWSQWLDQIHPDDRDSVLSSMAHARDTGERFLQEHRVFRYDDGKMRWLLMHGRIHHDEHGVPTRLMGIIGDITDRKNVEHQRDELLRLEKTARREAEQVGRLKDEFLATLSHELRSPMNAMLGWLQLIQRGALDIEQHAKAMETVKRNADLQNKLINDLLDVSRIIAGKLDLKPEQVQIGAVLSGAIESVAFDAQSKGVRIVTDLQCAEEGYFDADRLQQIIRNLISNAIKFTSPGGRIDVKAILVDDTLIISVADDGEGIEPEVLPHLFERFRQEDGSTTRRHGGLGLGLAIVRHLVELHGGTVTAESLGKGKGATFTVRLPMSGVSSKAFIAELAGYSSSIAPGDRRSRLLAGRRILVTDDEESARMLMAEVLLSAGADVKTAESAEDALKICDEWQPSLVIFDIGMPEVDGYMLLRQVRNKEGSDLAVPAIAVTGYGQEQDLQKAYDAGFQAHMVKPYNIDALIGKIVDLLDARK